jgi:hypothetical protein
MEFLTGKTIFTAATRRHLLSTISLIALKVALAVFMGVAVTVTLGTGSIWCAIGATLSHNLGKVHVARRDPHGGRCGFILGAQ